MICVHIPLWTSKDNQIRAADIAIAIIAQHRLARMLV
jgi:hypothetical protein